jgi:hypothetical protein
MAIWEGVEDLEVPLKTSWSTKSSKPAATGSPTAESKLEAWAPDKGAAGGIFESGFMALSFFDLTFPNGRYRPVFNDPLLFGLFTADYMEMDYQGFRKEISHLRKKGLTGI